MEPVNRDGTQESEQPCCGGATADPNAATCAGGDCGCGAPPAGRSRIRTLLGIVIVLAAIAVGLYSVLAAPGTAPAPAAPAEVAPAAAATAPVPQAPAAGGGSCCGGGAPAGNPGQPACGGNAPAPAPEAPACGGAPAPAGGSCCGGK